MSETAKEDLSSKWRRIEATISATDPGERNLEWGRRREEFYREHGSIPVPSIDRERLKELRDRHAGKRIFILGNGPSLRRTPLDLLRSEYTFGVNRIYLLSDRIDWKPTFYTANDWRVVPDTAREINGLTGMTFFFEERFRGLLREGEDVYYYTHTPADPDHPEESRFAFNIERGVRGAGSVVGTAIQLAYYMGFDPIYLIGCDLGYKVLPTVKQEGEDVFKTGVKLFLTSTQDDDPNHFDGRYFGKGRRWHDPNVPRMISGHEQCWEAISKSGRRIFNATLGGELEVYPRVQFQDLFLTERYPREAMARIEETKLVAGLWDGCEQRTMIDVGAHHGTSLSHFVEGPWKIFAFEPDPSNRRALESRYGDRENVVVDERAISEATVESAQFFTSSLSSGISGLLSFHSSHEAAGRVAVASLADVISEYGIDHVHFLKIDVEGHDLLVLRGNDWDVIRPDVIECEFEDEKTHLLGHRWRDICEFLEARGYSVYVSEWHPIVRYGAKHHWLGLKRYPCELEDPKAWGNLLAFRKDPGVDVIKEALSRSLEVSSTSAGRKVGPMRPAGEAGESTAEDEGTGSGRQQGACAQARNMVPEAPEEEAGPNGGVEAPSESSELLRAFRARLRSGIEQLSRESQALVDLVGAGPQGELTARMPELELSGLRRSVRSLELELSRVSDEIDKLRAGSRLAGGDRCQSLTKQSAATPDHPGSPQPRHRAANGTMVASGGQDPTQTIDEVRDARPLLNQLLTELEALVAWREKAESRLASVEISVEHARSKQAFSFDRLSGWIADVEGLARAIKGG